jgi:hypothetical protein
MKLKNCVFLFAFAFILIAKISVAQTFTRNDAGLKGDEGAQSGFFETSTPINYPAGASA